MTGKYFGNKLVHRLSPEEGHEDRDEMINSNLDAILFGVRV